ncbi:Tad domain-containing protein [Oharaeibacter diazotrophicus]|uniref:Tad domain-containing protein n=1 Tax=Oharaeibacter diazotrophicus TaxID=1920512 RepID=UPI000DC7543A|nr:pilus assembly protein TadG-related protein [Oharaeibacter diazotrophicus]BBE71289.1 hypothetical protein OHA_1_00860 [Pleomorphomonas sp. SM30]GLS78044.1 membrane protein [Oharaeibacter diazotrophicus]
MSLIFAVAMLVIIVAVGCAIDYGYAVRQRDYALGVLDTAVVTAAANLMESRAATDAARTKVASASVDSYIASSNATGLLADARTEVVTSGLGSTVTATADVSVPTSFLGIIGVDRIDFTLSSSSESTSTPYVDVTLLVDTSGSMALGATAADIDRLVANVRCAFACHDNPGADSFAWAAANGVTLRYDLIRQSVLNFADYIEDIDTVGHTRVQIYTFDDSLRRNLALTTDMVQVRANLPAAPQTSGETVGGTRWWTYADTIPGLIGGGGDGTSRAKAIKLVMMLTDGVQDPNRTWTWDTPLRDYVREFDPTVCDTLRMQNAKVGVVQVPYLDLTGDWGYDATLGMPSLLGRNGDRHADTTYALQRCGGDLYHLATSAESVVDSFKTLYARAVPPRLSR